MSKLFNPFDYKHFHHVFYRYGSKYIISVESINSLDETVLMRIGEGNRQTFSSFSYKNFLEILILANQYNEEEDFLLESGDINEDEKSSILRMQTSED